MYYIYKIENKVNHKKYIGLTNNIARRRARHFTDLRCNRHDNQFLQKEFNIYGQQNFDFTIEYEGDITDKEIGEKEKEFIKKYDSYHNGYNQNEGGNFGPSNGGSALTRADIYNILSACEFMKRPGQILSNIYGVSRTTISRINRGINHNQYKEEYEKMPKEEREKIFEIFDTSNQLIQKYANSSKITTKRHLTEEQVHMILYNYEKHIIPKNHMTKKVGVKSNYTLDCIIQGKSYQDYRLTYKNLTEEQKHKLATLIREN